MPELINPYHQLFQNYLSQENKKFYQKIALKLAEFSHSTLALDTRGTFLELGCGPGYSGECFSDFYPNAQWIFLDSSKKMIELSKQTLIQKNFDFTIAMAENTPFTQESVDVIFSNLSFHWFDFTKTIKEVKRILKKNGAFFLSLPLLNPNQKENGALLLKSFILHHRKKINRKDTQGFSEKKTNFIFQNFDKSEKQTISFLESFQNPEVFLNTLLGRGSLHAIFGRDLSQEELLKMCHDFCETKMLHTPVHYQWRVLLLRLF